MLGRRGGINEWGAAHNAKFGPAKYQLGDFSCRRVKDPWRPHKTIPEPRCDLRLGAHVVKSAESIKLLGVHLDRELRWHQQGAAALSKGEAWLLGTARIARASRGIRARNMRRLYLSVGVPRMLYAADIFLSPPPLNRTLYGVMTGRRQKGIVRRLQSIQRRAALAITGALCSTPSDILYVYADLLLMEYLIDKARAGAALRIATLPTNHPLHMAVRQEAALRRLRHPSSLHDLMANFDLHPDRMEQLRAVRAPATWLPQIRTFILSSIEDAVAAEKEDSAIYRVYTDGSGIGGQIGASAVLYERSVKIGSLRFHLGSSEHH
ncbi:hypothetical protein C8R45DRAFT_848310, partial [Mycena sanguinolenta]